MRRYARPVSLSGAVCALFPAASAWAETAAAERNTTYWELIASGGVNMIFLGLVSVALIALVVYHFKYVRLEKLVPPDFCDNLLFLAEKKEFDKAISVCRQQKNLISEIALKGLQRVSKDKTAAQETIQYEGRMRIERIWQTLTYVADIALIAPLLGLLGTIFGMIDAFHYFKATSLHPSILTQGLAKAMINTAFGLVIAVPALGFYAYFRGRISYITSRAEAVASELVLAIKK